MNNRNSRKNLKPIGQKSKNNMGQGMKVKAEMTIGRGQYQTSIENRPVLPSAVFENTAASGIRPIMIRKNNYITQQQSSKRRSNKLTEDHAPLVAGKKFSMPKVD
jgi:hypothetical protein